MYSMNDYQNQSAVKMSYSEMDFIIKIYRKLAQ